MAEILLSLTIIGVIAAITLPSLTGNINERTWNTQRKALYARFSQALALMPNLNGYGIADTKVETENSATETFITNGLAKVLKINNICDSEHLNDCGIVDKITALNGSQPFSAFPKQLSDLNSMVYGGSFVDKYNKVWQAPLQYNTQTAAFETANGESIAVFYNPSCQVNPGEAYWTGNEMLVQGLVCANFIYDLNGNKGPNTVGKDIGFMSALYAADPQIAAPVVLPNAPSGALKYTEAQRYCRSIDAESRIPNAEELISMFYNVNFIDQKFTQNILSSRKNSAGKFWILSFHAGDFFTENNASNVKCVKR